MEAVENLVVGEDAHLGIVVNESFVERAVDGLELYAVAAVCEYLAQAVELLGVVRKYASPATKISPSGTVISTWPDTSFFGPVPSSSLRHISSTS